MTHQYKKLPVTMKMWMQFNVIPRTIKGNNSNQTDTTNAQLAEPLMNFPYERTARSGQV